VKPLNYLRVVTAGGLLFAAIAGAGCAVRAGYYDSPHGDYHYWGPGEREPYSHWENERHREHTDYKKLPPQDRQDYWNWRHDHP